ncbi:MAG: hypothetical protein NTW28_21215 [Candidatus Solibacter sp.]|nr:hypothetical protein [Candidatus Solibacter sp.]
MMNRFRRNLTALGPLVLICLPAFRQEARLTPRVNQEHPTLAIGSPAPNFSLPGIDDKIHKLSDYKDPILVAMFISNHFNCTQAV